MNLEELKAKLDAKEITQEDYDAKVKELEGNKNTDISDEMKDYIAKQIQSATDKVRTEYVKKLTEKDDEIKRLEEEKKKGLSAKDLAEYESKQAKEQFEKERALFLADKNKFEATKLINKYGLIDEELSFLDLVMADTVEEMELRCQKLKKSIDSNVKKQVDERFKTNGRDINGSGGASAKETEADFGKSLAQGTTQHTEASQRATKYYFGE